MTDDVKALIAKARADASDIRDMEHESHHWAAGLIETLADALEAATSAPAKSVQEVLELLDAFHSDNRMSYDAYANLHDAVALLDVRPAPAVDREALVNVLSLASAVDGPLDETVGQFAERLADAVIAHLGARDVRDVQAEALERYADDRWGVVGKRRKEDNSMFGEELRIRERAQAIREARND